MKRNSRRSDTDKVIHIWIEEETLKKLKMHAASSKATIEQLVEELLRSKYKKMRVGNVKL